MPTSPDPLLHYTPNVVDGWALDIAREALKTVVAHVDLPVEDRLHLWCTVARLLEDSHRRGLEEALRADPACLGFLTPAG